MMQVHELPRRERTKATLRAEGERMRRDDSLPSVALVHLSAGDKLYGGGEQAVAPFSVVEGVLRVSVALIDGRERLVDIVGPGDVVGTAALEATRHAESVVAAEGGATVSKLDLAGTLARGASRQRLASALVKQLVRSRELADDLGLPMGARICRILARLATRLGESLDDNADGAAWRHLPFSLTHDDVALLAGCARVTATRVMGDLKDAGVLDGSRGDYALVPD